MKDNIRSNRPELFCKKGVRKDVAKFTGHLCQGLFLNNIAGLKSETWHRCFPAKSLRSTFSYKTPLVAASEILLFDQIC